MSRSRDMSRYLKELKAMGVIIEAGEDASKPLAEASNYLAVNLHQLLAEKEENVFFSPFYLSAAMAMLLCATEGETEYELRAVLGYDLAGINREEITSVFEQQISLLQNPESYTLSYATSMLSRKNLEVKDKYKQIITESFRASMLEFDFEKDKEKSISLINDWVTEKTNNMIPNLVQVLDLKAAIALLNVAYFKGKWGISFKEDSTRPQGFYNNGIEDRVKEVDMMHIKRYFFFYQNENLKALRLPYIGEKVSMLILLPHKMNGLESLEASLSSSCLRDITSKLWGCEVEVSLPRFRLEYSKSLIPHFKRLGIRRLFSRRAEMDFASDSPDVTVSQIFQSTVLEVSEESTKEGALCVTSCIPEHSNYPPPPSEIFIVDHPFLFFIYDIRNDLILFMGRVVEL